MHLDSRDALAERRHLVVEKSQAGDADQHQLVAQHVGRHRAREDLLGRDEALAILVSKIEVHRAVGLQRHADIADAELEVLAAAVGEPQERRIDRHADHLHRERRYEHLADAGDERHAPHHALRVGAQQPAPGGRPADLRPALQLPVVAAQRQLALRGDAHRGGRRRKGEAPVAVFEPGDAEHDLLAFDRLGERRIARRRCAIGLGEEEVHADGSRPRREDRAQELRHERARPGPLAARVERSLVDGDDHCRRARPAPRHEALVGIEDGVAQGAERRRLEADEQAEREEQGDARRARAGAESQSSISRPSCAAETRSACLPRVSSSRRCASRSAVSMAASLFAGSW